MLLSGEAGIGKSRLTAALLAQQRAIGSVLHQSMLEQVSRMRRHSLPEQQPSLNETVERRSQLCLWFAQHRRQ